jgi:hypothetical protein
MPSDWMLPNTIVVSIKTFSNVRGVSIPTATDTTYKASVQPMTARRIQAYGLGMGSTAYTVYFASDPGVNNLATIAWEGKTLSVQAPARNEAGRGRVWAVDCVELS